MIKYPARWFINGIEMAETLTRLHLDSVSEYNAGKYTCKGINFAQKTIKADSKLFVISKPLYCLFLS